MVRGTSQAVLPKAVKHLAKGADQRTARSLKRLASIWEERRVFGGSGLPRDLKEAVRDAGTGKDTAVGAPAATGGGAVSSEKTLMALQHRVRVLMAVRTRCTALRDDRLIRSSWWGGSASMRSAWMCMSMKCSPMGLGVQAEAHEGKAAAAATGALSDELLSADAAVHAARAGHTQARVTQQAAAAAALGTLHDALSATLTEREKLLGALQEALRSQQHAFTACEARLHATVGRMAELADAQRATLAVLEDGAPAADAGAAPAHVYPSHSWLHAAARDAVGAERRRRRGGCRDATRCPQQTRHSSQEDSTPVLTGALVNPIFRQTQSLAERPKHIPSSVKTFNGDGRCERRRRGGGHSGG